MAPPIKGYFYRRRAQAHVPVRRNRADTLYWCWHSGCCRKAVCCFTSSEATARRWVREFDLLYPLHPPAVAAANIRRTARQAGTAMALSIAQRARQVARPWAPPGHNPGGHFRRIRRAGPRHQYVHLTADPTAVIYWQFTWPDGSRDECCMHTLDAAEARERARIFGPSFRLNSREKFLRGLIRMAEHVAQRHPHRGVPSPLGTKRQASSSP
jgi:hypothetical protein